jgi:transposase
VLEALHAYLTQQQALHLPKGPMGQAITYALNQWQALCRFVDDERLPLDNNRSEGALRKAALGRKNFLFVGHVAAGENLAGLYVRAPGDLEHRFRAKVSTNSGAR